MCPLFSEERGHIEECQVDNFGWTKEALCLILVPLVIDEECYLSKNG